MKRLTGVLICFACTSMLFAQNKETYLETNFGLSYTSSLIDVVPGVSFLYGTKRFVSERQYWDFQLGIAVPTLATMKIGRGVKNLRTGRTVSAGIRVWPSHIYVAFGLPNPRCSNEVTERMKRRLARRGSDRTNLLCGEWNVSLEAGLGDTDLDALSFESIAIITVSHRWYFD
tara:strand:- start:772 stop:1290 length:519 start_codon:yes stop_codon:yes gene_type:complete